MLQESLLTEYVKCGRWECFEGGHAERRWGFGKEDLQPGKGGNVGREVWQRSEHRRGWALYLRK